MSYVRAELHQNAQTPSFSKGITVYHLQRAFGRASVGSIFPARERGGAVHLISGHTSFTQNESNKRGGQATDSGKRAHTRRRDDWPDGARNESKKDFIRNLAFRISS